MSLLEWVDVHDHLDEGCSIQVIAIEKLETIDNSLLSLHHNISIQNQPEHF